MLYGRILNRKFRFLFYFRAILCGFDMKTG